MTRGAPPAAGGVGGLVASASSSRPSTAHVADETEWRRATARADHVRPRTPLNHPDGTRNDPGSCVAQPGTTRLSIQESYDPNGVAFASGPSNPDGLGLRSYRGQAPGSLDAEFTARAAHQGFPGIVCGGILGALCESHANWTAAISIMDHFSTPSPPLTVTHSFTVELLSPTPVDEPLLLRSRVVGADPDYKSLDVAVGVYRRTGASVDAGPLPPPPQKQRSDGKEELDWKDEGAMHIDGYVLTARSVGRFRKIGPLRAIR
eukprot:PRCOL_00006757-RA